MLLPKYTSPSSFLVEANAAISRCISLRSSIITSINSRTQDYKPTVDLHRLDAISNEVCSVIDLCELVRNVHVEREWREGAENTFGVLFQFISELNTDREVS